MFYDHFSARSLLAKLGRCNWNDTIAICGGPNNNFTVLEERFEGMGCRYDIEIV